MSYITILGLLRVVVGTIELFTDKEGRHAHDGWSQREYARGFWKTCGVLMLIVLGLIGLVGLIALLTAGQ